MRDGTDRSLANKFSTRAKMATDDDIEEDNDDDGDCGDGNDDGAIVSEW